MSIFNNIFFNYKIKKLGISISETSDLVDNFLSHISSKFKTNNNWSWKYIYIRKKRLPIKASVAIHAKNGDLDICVKCYITDNNEYLNTSNNEYQNLKEIYNLLPPERANIVPKPIEANDKIFAMGWVSAPSMKMRLAWARFNQENRLSHLVTAAQTLEMIHQTRAKGVQQLDFQAYIYAAQCSGAIDRSWTQNFNLLIKALNNVELHTAPYCKLHGDYSPENILISPEGPTVIDLAHDKIGPNYHDTCHCIMYFSIYCNNFFCNTPNLLIRDINSFAFAYSGTETLARNEGFILMQWITLLIRWGRHDAKARDSQRAPHHRAVDWYFARQIKACCFRLEEVLASVRANKA